MSAPIHHQIGEIRPWLEKIRAAIESPWAERSQ